MCKIIIDIYNNCLGRHGYNSSPLLLKKKDGDWVGCKKFLAIIKEAVCYRSSKGRAVQYNYKIHWEFIVCVLSTLRILM